MSLYRSRGKKFFGSVLGEQIGGAWVGGYIVIPGVPGIGDAGYGLHC